MCLVKTPKLKTDPNAEPKDPTVIRNPYLDGVGPLANANRRGRSSLRITRGSGVTPTAPPITTPRPGPATGTPIVPPAQPAMPPVRGGGGRIARGPMTNAY
jgi:hypothetical protein